MKILLIITKSNWGGAQRYVYDIASAMSKKKHEVLVVAGGSGMLFDNLQKLGILTHSIASLERDLSLKKDIAAFLELHTVIGDFRPDVVHVNSSKVGGLGALAARLRGRKVVFTAHGWPFKEPRSVLSRGLIWFVSWLTAMLSHAVIVPSRDDMNAGLSMSGVTQKMNLIYHGRDVTYKDKKTARNVVSKYIGSQLSMEECVVGCIAELHANKGHVHLISAMKNISAKLVLVGGGELASYLKREVDTKGLSKKIFFTGAMPDAAEHVTAFDIFVLPSVKEGLPYVLIEAGGAAVPIVASNIGGISEITGGKQYLCGARDSECLSNKISFFVENDDCRVSEGLRQKKYIKENFSMASMIEGHEDLYQRLVLDNDIRCSGEDR